MEFKTTGAMFVSSVNLNPGNIFM